MPELPEVETVRRYLEENILNNKVKEIKLDALKSLRNVSKNKLNVLLNQKVTGLDRKAKHLIIRFEKHYIICHLRMEGKFFIIKDEKEMNELTNRKYDIIRIKTNKGIIVFQDKRRFATVDLFENNISYEGNPVLSKVANEPFDKDYKELFSQLNKRTSAIKSTLLNQEIISGLGNIYVDEVLFKCKIHPETKCNQVSIEQTKNIIKWSSLILNKAIKNKGTTIRSYTSSLGVEGSYQKYLNVHQRKDEPCNECGNTISKIRVGGRGTYFCNKCQIK